METKPIHTSRKMENTLKKKVTLSTAEYRKLEEKANWQRWIKYYATLSQDVFNDRRIRQYLALNKIT